MIADVIIICLLLINLSVSGYILSKLLPSAEARLDAEVEQAQREERNLIEEGFENIMTYSVMGKTGFEEV